MISIATPMMWILFAIFVVLALIVDLLMLKSSGPHRVTNREALLWSFFWIALSMLFNYGLWWYLRDTGNPDAGRIGMEFLTGYLVEKALAVDNIFVFLMIFNYFAVPPQSQQRVLIYGVLGAIVLRGILIFLGAALIQQFHWVLYLFGLFLLGTGIKMIVAASHEPDMDKTPVLRWLTGPLPLTRHYVGEAFVVREDGIRKYTPLFVVIVMVAVTDVIFAVDSIPAIFAITTDPFIVLTSNVFAVLGLRALYHLLAGLAEKFHLLAYGLALVLIFIGVKMLIVDFYKIPIDITLGLLDGLIPAAMLFSLVIKPAAKPNPPGPGQ